MPESINITLCESRSLYPHSAGWFWSLVIECDGLVWTPRVTYTVLNDLCDALKWLIR